MIVRLFYLLVPGKPEVSVAQAQGAILVSWELEQKNGIIQGYHVKYVRKDDSSDTKTLTIKKMEQQFKDLKAGKTYEFQVGGEYITLHCTSERPLAKTSKWSHLMLWPVEIA